MREVDLSELPREAALAIKPIFDALAWTLTKEEREDGTTYLGTCQGGSFECFIPTRGRARANGTVESNGLLVRLPEQLGCAVVVNQNPEILLTPSISMPLFPNVLLQTVWVPDGPSAGWNEGSFKELLEESKTRAGGWYREEGHCPLHALICSNGLPFGLGGPTAACAWVITPDNHDNDNDQLLRERKNAFLAQIGTLVGMAGNVGRVIIGTANMTPGQHANAPKEGTREGLLIDMLFRERRHLVFGFSGPTGLKWVEHVGDAIGDVVRVGRNRQVN